MKKLAFLIALSLGGELIVAQDLTSKKGEPILPEAGDWAISFDATPFLTYVGNMFSRDTLKNGAPYMQWTNSNYMVVNGKYFKDAKTAYRVSVRLGFGTSKQVGEIKDATQTTTPQYPNVPIMKEDDVKFKHHNIGVGLGIEKRKGKTRLQGYYGADAWIWESGQSVHYDYGNVLAATGNTPVSVTGNTTDFGKNSVLTTLSPALTSNLVKDTYGNDARITNATLGQTFGMGIRAFIGAEYFIFPKISIGAEYGYGLGFSITGNSSYTTESVGGTPAQVGPQTITIKRSNSFALDNDINGGGSGTGSGSIKLTLHF